MGGGSYLRGLDAALSGAGLPYGYAISTWSTGALLLRSHGIPEVSSVFLFAAGASAAYGMLRLVTKPVASDARLQLATSPHRVRAGAIHVAAMMLAAGSAGLASLVSSDIAWLLAPFAATVTYLGVTSLELASWRAASTYRHSRTARPPPARRKSKEPDRATAEALAGSACRAGPGSVIEVRDRATLLRSADVAQLARAPLS